MSKLFSKQSFLVLGLSLGMAMPNIAQGASWWSFGKKAKEAAELAEQVAKRTGKIPEGEIWPGQRIEGPDLFQSDETGEIFESLRHVDLVKIKGQEKAMLEVAGEFENKASLGAAIVGETGAGKTAIANAQELSFRKRALLNPDEKENYVVKINTDDLDFKNPERLLESIQELKAQLKKAADDPKKAGDLANVGQIVFYIDDLKHFVDSSGKSNGLFDTYISALLGVKSGKNQVKFMLETDTALYDSVIAKSKFRNKFNKVPVKESIKAADNLSILIANLRLIEPKILNFVDQQALSDLIRWVKQYTPEDGVAATAYYMMNRALAKQKAFLKDDDLAFTDETITEMEKAIADLRAKESAVANFNGSYADEVKAALPAQIAKAEQQLKEAQAQYERLSKIRSILQRTQSEYHNSPNISEARKKELAALYAKLEAEALQVSERRLAYEVTEYARNMHQRDINMANVLRFSGKMTLEEFRELLDKTIYGQHELKEVIMKAANKILHRLANPEKYAHIKEPIHSMFLWGPPGSGKTEGFTLLGKLMDSFFQVRGAEYQTPETINRLKGAEAGYVGYEEGGEIVGLIQKNPKTGVLFDEVEVMDNSIYQWIAQFYDPAVIADGLNRRAHTNQTVMGLTTNAIEDAPAHLDVTNKDDVITELIRANPSFEAKLFDRMDDIVYVPKPDKNTQKQILNKFLQLSNDNPDVSENFIKVHFSERAMTAIVHHVATRTKGSARQLRKAAKQFSEDAIRSLLEQGYWTDVDGVARRVIREDGTDIENVEEILGSHLEVVYHSVEGFALRILAKAP